MKGRGHKQHNATSKLDQEERVSGGDSDGSQRMVRGPGGWVFSGGLRDGLEVRGPGGGGTSAPTASGGVSQIPTLMFDCHTHISNTGSAGRSTTTRGQQQ